MSVSDLYYISQDKFNKMSTSEKENAALVVLQNHTGVNELL
jgi:hypothetical protein